MQRQTLRKQWTSAELQGATKPTKPTNASFDVLLRAVRETLKLNWCLYEEALKGVIRAGARGGDVTPWLAQMKDLANSKPEMAISHAGVLFLLEDIGIKLSPQPSINPLRAQPSVLNMAPPTNPNSIFSSEQSTTAPTMTPRAAPATAPALALDTGRSARMFTNPDLHRQIRNFFAGADPPKPPPGQAQRPANRLTYDPFEDDLAVFRAKLAEESEPAPVSNEDKRKVGKAEHKKKREDNLAEQEKQLYDMTSMTSSDAEPGSDILGALPVVEVQEQE